MIINNYHEIRWNSIVFIKKIKNKSSTRMWNYYRSWTQLYSFNQEKLVHEFLNQAYAIKHEFLNVWAWVKIFSSLSFSIHLFRSDSNGLAILVYEWGLVLMGLRTIGEYESLRLILLMVKVKIISIFSINANVVGIPRWYICASGNMEESMKWFWIYNFDFTY